MNDLTKNITWTNVQGTTEQIKGYVNNYAKDFNVYITNLVINNGNVSFTTYFKINYDDLVVRLIRKQYPLNEEFAILRKALTEKTNEYYIYNAYVEECKVRAKAFIEERNKALGV
jgi:hypothetical protein